MKVWVAVTTAPSHEGITPVVAVGKTKATAERRRAKEIERLAALPDSEDDNAELPVDSDMWVGFEEYERTL